MEVLAVDSKKLTPAEIVILAAGVVVFVFSFLPFYKIPSISVAGITARGGGNLSAWSKGLFPVATLIALFGLIMAAQIAVAKFASVRLPERVLTFTWEQVHVALGLFAALLAICYLIVDKGGADFGFGFFLELIGAVALAVGAIMLQVERAGATGHPGLAGPPV
jgi:hypothetical protein